MNAPLPMHGYATPADRPTRRAGVPSRRRRPLWFHHDIINCMLANPGITNREIAAKIGRTESTVSLIINSDIFRASLASRRAELNERLDDQIATGMRQVAEKTLGAIVAKIDAGRDKLPLPQLVDLADKMLDQLGYGPQAPSPVQMNMQFNGLVPRAELAAARQELREVEAARTAAMPRLPNPPQVIDGEVLRGASSRSERGAKVEEL